MPKKLSIVLATLLLIFTVACTEQTPTPTDETSPSPSPSVETISRDQVENTDLLTTQTQMDAQLLVELEAGYTFEEPFVVVDPYGISPLSAIALFNTDKPASISIEVEGKNGAAPLIKDFETVSVQHQIPIYGLYADEPAQVTLTAYYEDGTVATSILSVVGGVLPSGFIPVSVSQSDTSQMAEGWTVMDPATASDNLYAIDETGTVRWLLSNIYATAAGVPGNSLWLRNGNFLFVGDKYKSTLFEMDMTGRIVKEYMTCGYHHDMAELPDGNFLVLSHNINGEVVQDFVYEVDCENGEFVRIWDMNGYFNVDNKDEQGRHISDANYGGKSNDWLHVNAIDYDPESDTVMLSSRLQDAVIKMDLSTGEIVWILSDPNDAFPEYLESKLLVPASEDFEWQYGQHDVSLLPNGDILLFDNGTYRSKTEEGVVPAATDGYSRAVIYRVDEESMTVRQIWEFGREFGPDHLASYISSVQYLGEDHYLINFGGIVKDADGNATYGSSGAVRRTEIYEVKDGGIVFHASNGDRNAYRAKRMNPYADVQEMDLADGRARLGALYRFGVTEEIDFDLAASVSGGSNVSVTDNGAQLVVSANLDAGADDLALVFVGGNGTYGVALPAGDTVSYILNNSEIPAGTYDMYLKMDSVVYDLGLEWENLSTHRDFPAGCRVEVTSENGNTYGSGTYYSGTAFTVWTQDSGQLSVIPDQGFTLDSIIVNGIEQKFEGVNGAYTLDLLAGETSVSFILK